MSILIIHLSKHHLAIAGVEWDASKLCTVRMSKKIFPGYPSYSLGNICRCLEIPYVQQHRAMGDAEATAILFTRLVAADHWRSHSGYAEKR
jgi:DNA polymerase-3 subunit epsilon